MPGWTEALIIGGVVLLLFGARRLPDLGKSLASSIVEFKKGLRSDDDDDDTQEQSDASPPPSPESNDTPKRDV